MPHSLAIALLTAARISYAQNAPPASPTLAPYRNRILGVYSSDTGTPLEGVTITDVLSGTRILTTSTGTATLAFLPDGGSFIRIAKLGYETHTFVAAISPKDTAPITVILVHSTATTLAPVITTDTAPHYISPALTGFEERRKLGFGHFISEAELRKNDDRSLPNVLERIPDFVVWKTHSLTKSVWPPGAVGDASHTPISEIIGKPTPCYVTVCIDGHS